MDKQKSTKRKQIAIRGFDLIIMPKTEYDNADEAWKGEWAIYKSEKKKPTTEIGSFRFLGKPENGHLELTIDIDHYYINQGYATSALKAIADWCFARNGVFVVDAHIDKDNIPALRAFTNAGFVYRSKEHGIEHYSIVKPHTAWLGLYVVIGVWAGLLLGVVMAMPAVGFAIGMVIGLVFGKVMENRAKRRREEILGSVLGVK